MIQTSLLDAAEAAVLSAYYRLACLLYPHSTSGGCPSLHADAGNFCVRLTVLHEDRSCCWHPADDIKSCKNRQQSRAANSIISQLGAWSAVTSVTAVIVL